MQDASVYDMKRKANVISIAFHDFLSRTGLQLILIYAVGIAHRLVDMKEKGERLQETGGQVGLKISIQKTKEMRIAARQQESLELHGEAIERVSEFTYLESIISETGGTDEDITARIRKAQSTFSMLMPVWKEKCIRLQTKPRIFNTNVKSTLLYGSETWRSTKLPEHPLARGHFK